MKAMVIREFGGPEVLRFEEVSDPQPKPDEVVVKVHAVSVNYTLDVLLRAGKYERGSTLPHVLGVDPSGVVIATGTDVNRFRSGDRVAVHAAIYCGKCEFCRSGQDAECRTTQSLGIHRWGGYAEQVAVPQRVVYPIPDHLEFKDATVITRHFPTARYMLAGRAKLKAGEWILIMGAAGGLGASSIQVAKLMGATVIAAAGADERVRSALDFGADYGVNYRTQELAREVARITEGRLVDVVSENIGDPDLWSGAFDSLAQSGRLVTAGAHGGGTVSLDVQKLYRRMIEIQGSRGNSSRDVEWTMEQAQAGTIRPAPIDRVMPLHEAAKAHLLMERREVSGKLILDPTLSAGS